MADDLPPGVKRWRDTPHPGLAAQTAGGKEAFEAGAAAMAERPVYVLAVGHDLNDGDAERIQHAVVRALRPQRYDAEMAFLAASVEVWRGLDRLDAEPEGYHPIRMSVELRQRERAAWERYRDTLEPGDG